MAEIVLTNHSATCWHKDCTNAGTVWSHFQWWCAAHAPSSLPDPACTHSLTNVHYGVTVCSWCCGHLTYGRTSDMQTARIADNRSAPAPAETGPARDPEPQGGPE